MALTKLRLLWIDGEERSGKIFLLFCGCRKWITLEWIYYKNPKNSFCAAFCPKTPVQGFYYNSILGLYSYYFKFIKKIRKDPCIHFSETCKTSIWAYFVLQTSKQFFRVNFKTSYYYNFIQKKNRRRVWSKVLNTRLFQERSFRSTVSLYGVAVHCKKWEKLWVSIFYITWKTSFWVHFDWFLLAWKHQNKIFIKKKSPRSFLRLYVGVPGCKESGKSHTFIFQKTSFWALLAKKFKIFLKIIWQKFRKLLPVFPEKNSWKRENVQRVSHRAFILWVQQHTALISVRKKSICVLV